MQPPPSWPSTQDRQGCRVSLSLKAVNHHRQQRLFERPPPCPCWRPRDVAGARRAGNSASCENVPACGFEKKIPPPTRAAIALTEQAFDLEPVPSGTVFPDCEGASSLHFRDGTARHHAPRRVARYSSLPWIATRAPSAGHRHPSSDFGRESVLEGVLELRTLTLLTLRRPVPPPALPRALATEHSDQGEARAVFLNFCRKAGRLRHRKLTLVMDPSASKARSRTAP